MGTNAGIMNRCWARLLVEELVRSGVTRFCVSPGARCTPLLLAVGEHPRAEATVHYDERGAAYHALGMARYSGFPVALICTSGTAVANYFPAVIEASQAHIPLIVLTADRPPELQAAGANQTIDQAKMFGAYVRWEAALSCPSEEVPPEAVLTTIDQAVYQAWRRPSGPVHINCPYREPLMPAEAIEPPADYLHSIRSWQQGEEPYSNYGAEAMPKRVMDSAQQRRVQLKLGRARRGILVLGQLPTYMESRAAMTMATALGWPVFPDVTSGLRLGRNGAPWITHYDQLLHSARFQSQCAPDCVLYLGGAVVSKRLQQFLDRYAPADFIHVADHALRHDPIHRVTWRIESDLTRFCLWVAESIQSAVDPSWAEPLFALNHKAQSAVEGVLNRDDGLTEPRIAHAIARLVHDKKPLFLGNSMPVRDMDMFAPNGGHCPRIYANRGASGIDGTIATAAGIARSADSPTTAVLGDLAVLHDLSSLNLLRDTRVVLVALNNDGGGIFSHLPVAERGEVFERFFTAPHGLNLDAAARLFHLEYVRAGSIEGFEAAYSTALEAKRSTFIEVVTDRRKNLETHRAIRDAVLKAVEPD